MNARPTDSLAIAVAQLNPTVGDIDGNAGKARAARAQAARDGADLVAFSELFICGYPPEDLVLKPALQAACRAKVEELARETADGGPAMLIGTPWVEDGKLYNAYCLLDGGAHRGGAPQGRSAELRRVRREARVRARADAGAGEFPRRAARRADLRGYLGRRRGRDAGGDRHRIDDRAERLALPSRQGRRPPQHRGRARDRERPADGLRQPGRRPGRTGVRRRVVRPACRPLARRSSFRPSPSR